MKNCFLFLFIFVSTIDLTSQCFDESWHQSPIDPNKCYLVVAESKVWFDAELFCENFGANTFLTSINSGFETVLLRAIINGAPTNHSLTQLWIGFNDFAELGKYEWIDNEPIVYTDWEPGQPENNPAKQCVSLSLSTNGKWKTEDCSKTHDFICESYGGSSSNQTTTSPSSTAATTTTSSSASITSTTTTTAATTTTTLLTTTTGSTPKAADCYDLRHIYGQTTSGVYQIQPPGSQPFLAYCDMTTDDGGWTVFQKRQDNSEVFWSRTWNEYKNGFGTYLNQSYWLGLERMHLLTTKDSSVQLRIDIRGNRCTGSVCGGSSNPNGRWYGVWESFSIGNETANYQLRLGLASDGTLSSQTPPPNNNDPLHDSNSNNSFSTYDRSNGQNGTNCASSGNSNYGAWWYGSDDCGSYFLNGKYDPSQWGVGFSCLNTASDTNNFLINPGQSEMKLRKSVSFVKT